MITLKTAVNTRAPLRERAVPLDRDKRLVPSQSSLHHGIYTTFDEAYGSAPARTDPSQGNHYLTLLRSVRCGANKTNEATADTKTTVDDKACGGEMKPRGHLEGTMKSSVASLFDGVATRHSPSEWITEQQASSQSVRPVAQRDFYSTARRVERIDDDMRSGLVGNTQRTVDIMRKRATSPTLCPNPDVFPVFPAQRRLLDTDADGRCARSCLDIVDCQRLAPPSENHLGFEYAPLERLAPKLPVSPAVAVQQRLITDMSSSMPLFAGTAKVQKYAIPRYAGHVPSFPRNVDALHGNDTCPLRKWSKSYVTLATVGCGTDAGRRNKNPLVRNRSGTKAPETKPMKPKTSEVIKMTVEGSMLQTTLTQLTDAEQTLNTRVDKKPRKLF